MGNIYPISLGLQDFATESISSQLVESVRHYLTSVFQSARLLPCTLPNRLSSDLTREQS